jgi:diguanylate cyclase (GGDEF)-like protein
MSDPLTGLANRRSWDDELAGRRTAAAESGRTLCIALFDLDLFKRVNDACGHAAGDAVLRTAAKRLAASVRNGDLVARLGGDEFGLLAEGVSPADAFAVVERIRQSLRAEATGDCPFEITASAGFVHLPESAETDLPAEADLYRSASSALRQAKAEGRNRTVSAERS